MSDGVWLAKLRRAGWLTTAVLIAGALLLGAHAVLDWMQSGQVRQLAQDLHDPAHAQLVEALLQQQQFERRIEWVVSLLLLGLLGVAAWANSRALRTARRVVRGNDHQHQRLLDSLPQLIWAADAQGNAEFLNQRWVEYSGLPLPELMGNGWFSLVHPDDLEAVRREWPAALARNAGSMAQFRLRRHDGAYRWFQANFTAQSDGQGQALRWFGSSTDVEDTRGAQLALERSEKLCRETLNALSEGVMTFDAGGQSTGCNGSAARLLGVPIHALMHQPPEQWGVSLWQEDGQPMEWKDTPVARVLRHGLPCRDVLVEVHTADCLQRWLHIHAEFIPGDSSGNGASVVASFRDITERKTAGHELDMHRKQLEKLVADRTKELEATSSFLRLVSDKMQGRIAYWDRGLRCRFVNQTFCGHHGQPAEQVLGRHLRELRGETYYEQNRSHIEAVLAGQAQDFDRLESKGGGHVAQMRVQYFPDLRDGEVQGFVAFVSDISRHKEAEQLLRQANLQMAEARDRAMAANRAKSAFLANMSHEIRTPMNAIAGFTHLLRGELREPQQLQHLGRIATAADHLLQVVSDIGDLSRIEAGSLVLESIDFSMPVLLANACAQVEAEALSKGVALRLRADGLPERLLGDAVRLNQALHNLLSNAVAYTDTGSVTLRVSIAERNGESLSLLFEVIDTGHGIAPVEFARLFDPFAQAERGSTRMHGGSGLGLAITRHIAQQMGGDAGGESQLGQGSTFWFTARLWLASETAAPAPTAAPTLLPDGRLDGVRVLLVEDNPVNQEVAGQILRAAGVVVELAGDGQQALEVLGHEEFDLVLMDVQMPRMDGLRATRALRQDPALRHLPVIALTANALPQDRQDCLDAGMNDYLAKPVAPQVLYTCLRRWLPAGRARQPMPAAPLPVLSAATAAAATAEVPDLAQRLAGLSDVLDLEQAYANCGGQATVLARAMASYVRHYAQAGADLLAEMQAADLSPASRRLHAMRGASAALGATALVKQIKQVEAAIGEGQAPQDLLVGAQAVAEQLRSVLEGMGHALAGTDLAMAN